MADAGTEYYQELYRSRECNETLHNQLLKTWKVNINKEIISKLEEEISIEEISINIKHIKEGKSPGSDGITPTFFKTHMVSLLPIMKILFNHFFNKGIDQKYKEGILIPLFKSGDQKSLSNYRPITLQNVLYKIYSTFLPTIISNTQTGFIPRRILHDNIISLDAIIERINKELPSYDESYSPIITFYDFEKAFDSLSHKSIIRILDHLKIPQILINTIADMLKDSSIRVSINGTLSKPFKSLRGTKKGDPISLTLFAMVVECMATAIKEYTSIQGMYQHKILQFADDTSTISRNYQDAVEVNNKILEFCESTTAKVNINKCKCITFKETRTLYSPIKKDSTERYLGFNFNSEGIVSKIPQITNRITNQLNVWKTTSSTLRGRLNILKTYGLSQLTFHLYINKIDNIGHLSRTCENFIFNSTKSKKSKSRSIRSFNSGGIELWDLQIREKAQKAWTFERYLHSTKTTNQSVSFANLWTHITRIKKDCRDAWLKLFNKQTRKTQNSKLDNSLTTAYIKIPKLKTIPRHTKY